MWGISFLNLTNGVLNVEITMALDNGYKMDTIEDDDNEMGNELESYN